MTADNLSQTVSKLSERLEELQAKCVSNPADAPEILSDALESLQASLKVISSADEDLMQQNEELLEATEENGRLLAAVQEEHDKLSALVNSISDEIWFVDTQRKFTLTNPSALREFSLASGDVDVKKLAASLEVFRPDGSPRPVEEAPPLRALQGDVVRNQEEIIRTPATNELRYRQVNSSPVKDAKGNTIGSVSVVRDITERKQMEVELDRLASFPKINPNPIIEVDLEGYVHFINPAAKKLFPGLQERGPNHPWLTDWGQMMQIFRKSGASTYVRDLLIDDKWYQQSMYFVPDIQRIRIYGLDITGHKKAEIALQEANEELEATGEELRQQNDEIMRAQSALQESEEKYRTIVETANEGIWVVDSETQTTYVNKRMAEMLGYSPEEMIGKKSSEFMDEEYKAYLELMLERRRQLIEESIEVKFFRKDGSFLWALSNASSLRDRDGKFAGSMGMLTDITERKRTEDALQEAKDQLEMRVKERTSELEQANFRQQEEIAERKKAEEALHTAWAYNRSLIEASLDPLVTIGPDGKITDVNAATKSVTGYRFEELVGTDFSDYFTDPENARAGYEKVFKEGYVRDYPLEIQHSDGIKRRCSIQCHQSTKIIRATVARRIRCSPRYH